MTVPEIVSSVVPDLGRSSQKQGGWKKIYEVKIYRAVDEAIWARVLTKLPGTGARTFRVSTSPKAKIYWQGNYAKAMTSDGPRR